MHIERILVKHEFYLLIYLLTTYFFFFFFMRHSPFGFVPKVSDILELLHLRFSPILLTLLNRFSTRVIVKVDILFNKYLT